MALTAWYQPYLQLTSDHVLLSAACVWDRLQRLVPFGHRPRDSKIAKLLAEEFDLFEVLAPPKDISPVDKTFIEWLDRAYVKNQPECQAVFGKLAMERTAAKPHRLFKQDYHRELTAKLEELGLAKDFAAGWNGTSRLLQDVYLTALAQHTQAHTPELQQATLLRDRTLFDRVYTHTRAGFGNKRLFRLTVELPFPVPGAWRFSGNFNPQPLQAFRENSASERKRYLDSVEACAQPLDTIETISMIGPVLRQNTATVFDAFETLRRRAAEHDIQLEPGYLYLSASPPALQDTATETTPTRCGKSAYTLQAIPVQNPAQCPPGKASLTCTLSIETPLAKHTGFQKFGNKIGNWLGFNR